RAAPRPRLRGPLDLRRRVSGRYAAHRGGRRSLPDAADTERDPAPVRPPTKGGEQVSQTEAQATTERSPDGRADLAVLTAPTSPAAEADRSLRSTVTFANVAPPVRTLLIADAGTDGQHSTVAANLAAALALGGDSVVLVDAGLRRPTLHGYFG